MFPSLLPSLLLVALGAANPDLDQGVQLMNDLRYPEAARALDAAWKRPDNDRPTVLKILELKAVIAAILEQPGRARTSFRMLLSIAPEYQLGAHYAPRVMTPYLEAKSWAADRGALRFEAEARPEGAPVEAGVAAVVSNDPLKLAREVRFHVRAGGQWRTSVMPLVQRRVGLAVQGPRVEWWAELLGESGAVLELLGSEARPLVWGAAPLPMPLPPPVARVAVPARPADPSPPAAARGPGLSALGWGLVALGGAAAGAGGYFGWRSAQARARIAGAGVGPDGVTIGLTQRDAYALDAGARQDAVIANVLFGVGAAAGAGGAGVFVISGRFP